METGDLASDAIKLAEQNGIVFIDEIDKICTASDSHRSSADASAEGCFMHAPALCFVLGLTCMRRCAERSVATDRRVRC